MDRLFKHAHYSINIPKNKDYTNEVKEITSLAKCNCVDFYLFSFPKLPMELSKEDLNAKKLEELLLSRNNDEYEQIVHAVIRPNCTMNMDCLKKCIYYNMFANKT